MRRWCHACHDAYEPTGTAGYRHVNQVMSTVAMRGALLILRWGGDAFIVLILMMNIVRGV